MVSPDLMRGDGWVRCCICGELHTRAEDGSWPTLWMDDESQRWDMCDGCGTENLEPEAGPEGT